MPAEMRLVVKASFGCDVRQRASLALGKDQLPRMVYPPAQQILVGGDPHRSTESSKELIAAQARSLDRLVHRHRLPVLLQKRLTARSIRQSCPAAGRATATRR